MYSVDCRRMQTVRKHSKGGKIRSILEQLALSKNIQNALSKNIVIVNTHILEIVKSFREGSVPLKGYQKLFTIVTSVPSPCSLSF